MENLFDDALIEEYVKWKDANPDNFSWWNFVNMKADLDTALAFAKFYCPEIIIVDGHFILKDKYSVDLYNAWKIDANNSKINIEKMMNIYAIRDFFHIHYKQSDNDEDKIVALGHVLKFFWDMSFKQRYPDKSINVVVFEEDDGEYFITVYEGESGETKNKNR